ncbi:MAG: DMT family transporter, partial [Planctomycetota bacterium]
KPGLITGLASCTGTIFYLKAMVLPSSVVFPISAGVGMIGGVALTAAVYGEKINRWKVIGIVVSIASIAIAVMREKLAVLF